MMLRFDGIGCGVMYIYGERVRERERACVINLHEAVDSWYGTVRRKLSKTMIWYKLMATLSYLIDPQGNIGC